MKLILSRLAHVCCYHSGLFLKDEDTLLESRLRDSPMSDMPNDSALSEAGLGGVSKTQMFTLSMCMYADTALASY